MTKTTMVLRFDSETFEQLREAARRESATVAEVIELGLSHYFRNVITMSVEKDVTGQEVA